MKTGLHIFFLLLLTGTITCVVRRDGWYKALPWAGLSPAFLGMGLDEFMELHERFTDPVRALLGTGGVLHFAWIIPYAAFSLIFAFVYARFLMRLPDDTLKYIVLAGILYVGGCIGMALFGGAWIQQHGRMPAYYLLVMVEESAELTGCVVFIDAFLNHLDKHLPDLKVRITSE